MKKVILIILCLFSWIWCISQIIKLPIPDKVVVLTFDDAVSTHYSVVAPILEKYDFGATFYVCEFPPDFEDPSKYMSWDQIKSLQDRGFEISNHTRTHTHVNQMTRERMISELEYIEDRCAEYGIPKPTSFAYPAYDTHPMSEGVLSEKGYWTARVGGAQAYNPEIHHPYLIPSFSTTGENKDRVLEAIKQANNGRIVVLTVHGVPDYAHDWVTTPLDLFEEYMAYLDREGYQVLAMRDLKDYIDFDEARKTIKPHWTVGKGADFPIQDTTRFSININQTQGVFKPIYTWFGHDEPNYTYMKDGRKLIRELAELSPVPIHLRTHNLLTNGDGIPALKWGSTNVYTEDDDGNPIYDWSIMDRIFDTYIEYGVHPLVEIGFMPEALSSKPVPYRHYWDPTAEYSEIYTGWAYPPNDYKKWAELVYQWVRHAVERYGAKEVEQWYWQVWNEPNIGYWQGTSEEYLKLYDYSADAVKRALPTATFGGPHTTGPRWDQAEDYLRKFLDHCDHGVNYATGSQGSPLDFIAFHAKGAPRFIEDRVQMNMGAQLRDISKGFEVVASYPQFKDLPIVLGESDPEGCAACSMDVHPQNGYRNGTMYSSYTAASFARKMDLAEAFGVNLLGAVTWAFEFENQPWFHGFRDLATNGVNNPFLNVFRMFGMMGGNRIKVQGDWAYDYQMVRDSSVRGTDTDVGALVCRDGNEVTIMVWNYHDDDIKGLAQQVQIELNQLPGKPILQSHFRIDEHHSNAYSVWQRMGSPRYPTSKQIEELHAADALELLDSPHWVQTTQGVLNLSIELPRQGISLIKLTW